MRRPRPIPRSETRAAAGIAPASPAAPAVASASAPAVLLLALLAAFLAASLAASIAACRSGPRAPFPGSAQATPAASRLAAADTVAWGRTAADRRAREAGEPVPAYEDTHARTLDGLLAPYAGEYAALNGIDTSALLAALLPEGPAPGRGSALPVSLSSLSHLSGKWTFYRSASVRVHQLLRLRAEGPASRADTLLAALYSPHAPADLLLGDTAAWSLSLLQGPAAAGPGFRVVSSVRFRLPPPEAGDDIILLNTALERSGDTLRVAVERVSEGGAEDRVQALAAAWIVAGPPWRLIEAGRPDPSHNVPPPEEAKP